MSSSSKALRRAAKARARRASQVAPENARLRDFICWRRIGASPAATFTAPAPDVWRKPAPLPATGQTAPTGGRGEQKRKGQFYTRPDLAELYLRRLKEHVDLDGFQIVEPSAGSGSFMDVLPYGTFGCDIEPLHDGVFTGDFLTLQIDSNRRIACVGNPPFGRNSKLAKRFFNHAATFSEIIAFILPRTFRKTSIINGLDDRFHLIHEEEVPADAFVFQGRPYSVPTVFQIWVKSEDRRPALPDIKTHADFEFASGEDGDFAMQRVGKAAGEVHDGLKRSRKAHYFIKADAEGVVRRIMEELRPEFEKAASNTAGKPSLAMSKIVAIYTERIAKKESAE